MSIIELFHKLGIHEDDIVTVASVIRSLERELGVGHVAEIKNAAVHVKNLARDWDRLVESWGGKKEVEELIKERGRLDEYNAHKRWIEVDDKLPG